MYRNKNFFCLLGILVVLAVFSSGVSAQSLKDEVVPGEIIIKFVRKIGIFYDNDKKGVALTTIPSINVLNEKFGVYEIEPVLRFRLTPKLEEAVKCAGLDRVFHFKMYRNVDMKKAMAGVERVIDEYSKDPNVEWAEPRYLGRNMED